MLFIFRLSLCKIKYQMQEVQKIKKPKKYFLITVDTNVNDLISTLKEIYPNEGDKAFYIRNGELNISSLSTNLVDISKCIAPSCCGFEPFILTLSKKRIKVNYNMANFEKV